MRDNTMKGYIFITEDYESRETSIIIKAENEFEAISKAFEYYGGSYLSADEFKTICEKSNESRICELFEKFTRDKILYFGLLSDKCYLSNLKII